MIKRGTHGLLVISSGRKAKARLRDRARRATRDAAASSPRTKATREAARLAKVSPKGQHGGVRVAGARKLSKRERDLQATLLSGTTPLEYMLRVLRDTAVDTGRRDWAAAAAAPYVHARLASTELSSDPERPVTLDAGAQLGLVRQIAFALALGARLQREATPRVERLVAEAKA